VVTIGITTYNRLETLKITASSLYQSDISIPHNIRIYDDNSTEFGKDELEKLFPTAASIRVNTKNMKSDQNIFGMYEDFLATPDEYLFNADSDLIYRKNFLVAALELVKKTSGILTLFNAASHPVYREIDNDLCLKKTIGSAGTLFHRSRVEEVVKYIHPQKDTRSLDWRFSNFFDGNDIPVYCVKKSLVQHIGYSGQNSFYCFDYGKNYTVESVEQGQIINDILEDYARKINRLENERMDNLPYHLKRVFVIIMKKILPSGFYNSLRQKIKS
jgi:hypothetical protein